MATSISNAYEDTNIHPNNTIPLDFGSVLQLPESHVWTDDDDSGIGRRTCLARQPGAVAASPPVIDLRAPDAMWLVGDACRRWGVFQVTNHGVPHDLVEDVEEHARRLFKLPNDQKLKALRAPNGVTGYGVPRFSPFFPKLMWHEGFTIAGSAMEHAKLLWPHHYEEFCDAMDKYKQKMKSLAYNILLVMLKALGVDEEDREKLSSSFLCQSDGALQLNSYPCCPNPSQAIGLAPHTDSLLITILHQNDTNGLQIMQEGVGWVPIRPTPGALVVNIGNLMHILSNGAFHNMYHRVVPNETSHRFTIGYFYGPPADSVLAPLPKLPGPPRFRAVTVKEYIGLKNKHLEKETPPLLWNGGSTRYSDSDIENDFVKVAEFFDAAVKLALKIKADANGTKLKDFVSSMKSDIHQSSALSKLCREVEDYAKQFPTIGFQKETMKYKD